MNGGACTMMAPAVTTSAGAYTAGDVVGGPLVCYPGAMLAGNGTIANVIVFDNANQKAPLTFLFFKSLPTGTYTDNAAFAWGSADKARLINVIDVGASDYTTLNSAAYLSVVAGAAVQWDDVPNVGIASLYLIIVTTGTPTYAANATTLLPKFGLVPGRP
jgi:hypothetical protein